MSLLLAFRTPSHWLLMADSCYAAGDQRTSMGQKLRSIGAGWLLAGAGFDSAEYLLLHDLDYDRLEDPLYHWERWKKISTSSDPGSPRLDGNWLFAKRERCYVLNGAGELWPVMGMWETCGMGSAVAEYLLRKAWPDRSWHTEEEIIDLGTEIISEVAEHFGGVTLPVVWVSTADSGTVHIIGEGE